MRPFLLVTVLIFSQPAAAEPKAKGWAAPLPLESSSKGVRTCSRTRPVGITGFWQLSAAEVASIDHSLASFLRQPKMKRRITLRLEELGRQFLGFVRGRKRYVYINVFPAGEQGVPDASSKELYIPCDRGPDFWGVEYDIEGRSFSHFSPDGLLPPPSTR